MKRLIRWALNHVPRPLLQRLAGWAVPVAGLFYVGRGRECPVCGARRRRFLPYGYVAPRADALSTSRAKPICCAGRSGSCISPPKSA